MIASDDASFPAYWGRRAASYVNRLVLEVHRRSVWQVIGLYALGGWVVLQIVDTLTGTLRLPEWFPPFALVLLLIGFPMVIATAFVQRGEEPPPLDAMGTRPLQSPSRVDRVFTWKNAFGGGVLAFALWGVFAAAWFFVIGGPPQPAEAAPVGATLTPRVNQNLPAVAVLPLADLSPEGDFQYFADGVQEELSTRLSRVSGLLVLAGTSVRRFRTSEHGVREIAEQLGAAVVVEGSVRQSGDQLRVTLHLIDAPTGALIWADTYEGTREDIFGLQEEIAEAVTRELEIALLPVELSRLPDRASAGPIPY